MGSFRQGLFLVLVFVEVQLSAAEIYSYKELFFDQYIDHYSSYWKHLNKETYKQRYLVQGIVT